MPRPTAPLADVLDLTRHQLPRELLAQGVISTDAVSGQEKLNLVRQRAKQIGSRPWSPADTDSVIVGVARKSNARRVLLDLDKPDDDLAKALRTAGFKVIWLNEEGNIQARAPRRQRQRRH